MDLARAEIMKNRFSAMAEEAATVAYRTAHTTFVKQTQDFQVALARPGGEFFAYPMLTGVTSGGGQTIAGLIGHFDRFAPGDVVISNDPFRTGGLVTHMMDIHLARPVFYQDELICFAWSFVHASDIGGAVPGSISPELYESFQEGLRLRPTRLMRAGELNQDVVNILQDNSRIGEEVWGDLEAMMAAMRLLERRAVALCERVGVAAFRQGIDDVMDYSEAKARSVIAGLRDGEYSFSDYVEGGDEGEVVHIHCRLRIAGDEAEIDYAGSDPQVHAALNFTARGRSHPFLCLGLTNYIQTMEPSIPVNGGMMRPIRAHAPSGTVMNADFPAAMGNRWVAAMRTYDALVGCLNQAIPQGITACGAGQAGIISVSWQDAASARTRVAVVEPFSGGSGGRVRADGVDANDTMIGYLKMHAGGACGGGDAASGAPARAGTLQLRAWALPRWRVGLHRTGVPERAGRDNRARAGPLPVPALGRAGWPPGPQRPNLVATGRGENGARPHPPAEHAPRRRAADDLAVWRGVRRSSRTVRGAGAAGRGERDAGRGGGSGDLRRGHSGQGGGLGGDRVSPGGDAKEDGRRVRPGGSWPGAAALRGDLADGGERRAGERGSGDAPGSAPRRAAGGAGGAWRQPGARCTGHGARSRRGSGAAA